MIADADADAVYARLTEQTEVGSLHWSKAVSTTNETFICGFWTLSSAMVDKMHRQTHLAYGDTLKWSFHKYEGDPLYDAVVSYCKDVQEKVRLTEIDRLEKWLMGE